MPTIDALLQRSRELILAAQAPSGAYPACENFPAYAGYSWFRDGSFIADAMSRVGEVASAGRFHDWCARVLAARSDRVDGLVRAARQGDTPSIDAMLPTRFTLDGTDGSSPWWDFQLDGYGTWLWAVHEHAARHGLGLERWQDGIAVACDYLAEFWHLNCYDWWEEHAEQRHGSTLGAVFAGLTACAASPVLDAGRRERAAAVTSLVRDTLLKDGLTSDGALAKWAGSNAVDASLAACVVPYGVVAPGSEIAEATLARIEAELAVDGGVHRFAADVFYGGGQWPLLTCLLGWNHLAAGRPDDARALLDWAVAQADADLDLPEQAGTYLLHPEHQAEWVSKWGPVARPLLWSHAMVLTLASELGLIQNQPPKDHP